MFTTRMPIGWRTALIFSLCTSFGLNIAEATVQNPEVEAEVEFLTRGPVHEAFAGTVSFDPEPGLIVQKEPPAAIEELPPDQRPAGDDVAWIPGYWAWDDERTDFLWISGIWRTLPPGRQWVPGYWGRTSRGVQWTSGYWADAQATEVEYLPEPPASVEAGPNIAAPTADHTWLPGSWIWQQNRYAWQPGYWAAGNSDWDWVPAHYMWSPRGYVFVDGYYDYSVDRRGIVFAPVYFNSRAYAQPGYTFSPSLAISTAVFGSHLFLRPNYGHYYFGDYYAAKYSSFGMSPWFSYQNSRQGYDPLYARQRWVNRQNRDWEQTVQSDFKHRRDDEQARPPHTWYDQRARQADTNRPIRDNAIVAESLKDLVSGKDRPRQLKSLDTLERTRFIERQQAVRQLSDQRQKLEQQGTDQSGPRTAGERSDNRAKISPSPILSSPATRGEGIVAPPKRPETPRPDSKIEPLPRKPRAGTGTLPPSVTVKPDTLPNAGQPKPRSERDSVIPRVTPKADLPNNLPKSAGTPASPMPTVDPKPQPNVKPQPGIDPKTRPGVQPKPSGDPKLQPSADPKREPRVNPKPQPSVNPKPQPKVNPKPQPRVDPKPQPSVNPKPQPSVNPKPQPSVNPKPQPSVNPKPQPRVDPKPQPRVDPKPQPRVDPKPQPKSEPKSNPPGPKQNDKPKGGSKDGPRP